ncbi:hypothetical protein CYY_004624 [Polysphondylium violaceum]|uniref:PPPDE domain-containing protein n=1 Tax=Polysphondylium violaceum TaxID=133409 RepID=A0A8J4UZ51_9MYCE|nr:hypothetical protein CYY_004624 [Polysphondylium violaceum]
MNVKSLKDLKQDNKDPNTPTNSNNNNVVSLNSSSSVSSNGSMATNYSQQPSSPNQININVYDLHPINNIMYQFGLGAFHSGVEIFGVEYSFGGHEFSFSGVFEIEPKTANGVTFRETICIGETPYSYKQVQNIVDKISEEYSGLSYHPLQKNCNSFSQELVKRLLGANNTTPFPAYINRLAHFGNFLSCLLPSNLPFLKTPNSENQKEALTSTSSNSSSSSSTTTAAGNTFPGKGYALVSSLSPPFTPAMESDQNGTNISLSTFRQQIENEPSSDDEDNNNNNNNDGEQDSSSNSSSGKSGNNSDAEEQRRRKLLSAANKRLGVGTTTPPAANEEPETAPFMEQ